MSDLIHEPPTLVTTPQGLVYSPRIFGELQPDGTWHGWIEFRPATGGPVLRTDRETTQPNREALDYWAGGLEPVYFEGAFERADIAVGTS
jgi:hypothetical protein